jgi:hypothetical protein
MVIVIVGFWETSVGDFLGIFAEFGDGFYNAMLSEVDLGAIDGFALIVVVLLRATKDWVRGPVFQVALVFNTVIAVVIVSRFGASKQMA